MKKPLPSKLKLRARISLAIALGLYSIAFFYFRQTFGLDALGLAIFPVLLGTWYFRIWGGLFATLLSLLITIGILYFGGEAVPWLTILTEGLIDTLTLFSASFLFGYLALAGDRNRERISRSNKLIHALTHVAAQMKISSNPDDVMDLMGKELGKLDLKALVTLFIPGSQELTIRYTSLDPNIVEKFERLAKINHLEEFRISSENLPANLNLAENQKPILLRDYDLAISALLPGFPVKVIKRIMRSGEFSEKSIIGHFPLIYQEKILGFLWLWGDDVKKEDIPALSIFSGQVASTLENARLFAELEHLALRDGLTGLFTRRHFFELAYEEFYRARRYGNPLSVLMLDLDHFKRVNDTYGHTAGDTVLEKTAEICKSVLRAQDIMGRYGGEEFVVLLVETDLASAEIVAKRLRKLIANSPIETAKGTLQLTIVPPQVKMEFLASKIRHYPSPQPKL